MKPAIRKAVRKEARGLRDALRKGIKSQSPGGESFRKLSPLTTAARRMRTTKRGSKHARALDVTGEMIKAIKVHMVGDNAFVGIEKRATGSDGRRLQDIARMNDQGSKPIRINMTPKMRRFLAVLFRKAGGARTGGGGGRKAIIVRIPARPFVKPVYTKWRAGFDKRFDKALSKHLPELS